MSAISIFLPLFLVPLAYAAILKLSALLLRRMTLSWKHAVLFALMALVVGVVGTTLNKATGSAVAMPLVVLVGLVLQLALGGWYLGPRAKTRDEVPVAFKGGALLSLLAYLMIAVVGIGIPLAFRASNA